MTVGLSQAGRDRLRLTSVRSEQLEGPTYVQLLYACCYCFEYAQLDTPVVQMFSF